MSWPYLVHILLRAGSAPTAHIALSLLFPPKGKLSASYSVTWMTVGPGLPQLCSLGWVDTVPKSSCWTPGRPTDVSQQRQRWSHRPLILVLEQPCRQAGAGPSPPQGPAAPADPQGYVGVTNRLSRGLPGCGHVMCWSLKPVPTHF